MDVTDYFDEFTRRDWQTTTEGTVRMAVVGLGSFARNRVLPVFSATEFCEVTLLVSGSPTKAGAVAEEFAVDRVIGYDEFNSGVATDRYDAVYVATPPAFHREYTETAARLGKPVLCEKPLATNVHEAEQMVEACANSGVTLMTAYRLRAEPAIRRLHELIQDGVIGNPRQIKAGFSSQLLDNVSPDSWRFDPDIAGGGALIDLGVYPLHLTRFLIDSTPDAVWAETTSQSPQFDRVEEHVVVELLFPNGLTASCTASLNAHPDNRLQVLGTEGQVLIRDPFSGRMSQELLVERHDSQTKYVGPSVDEVREEFDYFAHCILTNADCETDGEEGLTDLRIIEAAYESAETDKQITI
ncbi:Gfo/Idh/MocA family oxidoreductase [Natronococcus sp. JC468]|uniref:D-xylose 1-dehydrogenase Gfo6 n=1 Tax=Natronococcus sp. JC468 TaxID=1961921 RepID=UPI00143A8F1C|nr:D-xylose 1-dehydrogenase Gfo6 [Natronococcus sp. JC468]NKE38022.1 Gfo/Idh/MocA family oxidoreductase [Natronococcus sp. JC468]